MTKKVFAGKSLKPRRTKEQKIKRRYFLLKILCALLFVLLAGSIYFNFNYMVLKFLISGNYIYTDALDELYKQQLGEENFKGNYLKDFDNVVIGVLTEKIRSINNDSYTYLYTPKGLTAQSESTKAVALETEIKALDEQTCYFRLPNVSKYSLDYVEKNKAAMKGYDYLIFDLRSNYGGDMDVLYKIASIFLPKGAVIGSEITRVGLFSKTVKSKTTQYAAYEEIIILIDKNTASAAEGITNALRENLENVTVIGTKSFGKGIGQITIPLLRGYAVKTTVMLIETPLGNSIHQVGIIPDIEYTEDDIIEFALGRLKSDGE